MKKLDDGKRVTGANAWGRDSTTTHTHYEIELSDVNTIRDHYLGHNHKSIQFTRKDVGRTINVMTDGTGWTCWSFVN